MNVLGPCPPCPKMVSVSCMCGKAKPLPRRCSNKVQLERESLNLVSTWFTMQLFSVYVCLFAFRPGHVSSSVVGCYLADSTPVDNPVTQVHTVLNTSCCICLFKTLSSVDLTVCVCIRVFSLSQSQCSEVCVWPGGGRAAMCQPSMELSAGMMIMYDGLSLTHTHAQFDLLLHDLQWYWSDLFLHRCVAPSSPVGITPVKLCVMMECVLHVLAP